jgi:hypothetical protein
MFEYLKHLDVFQHDNKFRLGRKADGGYVMADIGGYDAYISCGIGSDDSVSNDVIEKFKIQNNFAYDGTIAEYPKNGYPGMNFFKKNIGATNTDN